MITPYLWPDGVFRSTPPDVVLRPDGTFGPARVGDLFLWPDGVYRATAPTVYLQPDGTFRNAIQENSFLHPDGTFRPTGSGLAMRQDGTFEILPDPEPPFNPDSLNPYTWYDAGDPTTLFGDTAGTGVIWINDLVARWNSKGSGPQLKLTQTNTLYRPQFLFNPPPYYGVFFTTGGISDYLQGAGVKGGFIASNKTTFCVFFHSAVTGFRVPIWYGQDTLDGNTAGRRWGFQSVGGSIGLLRWDPTYDILAERPAGLYIVVADTDAAATRCWIGNTLIGTKGGYRTEPGRNITNMGALSLTGGGWYSGSIREYFHCETKLSDEDRSAVITYLAAKWGITL